MAIAVIATRFLPFLIFTSRERTPHFVRFLGKYLASAVFGMLIIYCNERCATQREQSCYSSVVRHLGLCCPSPLAKEYASDYCRWHTVLYAIGSKSVVGTGRIYNLDCV